MLMALDRLLHFDTLLTLQCTPKLVLFTSLMLETIG